MEPEQLPGLAGFARPALVCFPAARIFYRIAGSNSLSYLGRNKGKLESQFLSMKLQMDRLLARENSQRARQACLKFLQDSLIYFYPEYPDLVKRCEEIAASLGSPLGIPQLPGKYAWIQRLFGWTVAKESQLRYNKVKLSLQRSLDWALFSLETQAAKRDAWQRIGKSAAREVSANG